MVQLSNYILATQDLLRDANSQFTSQSQLIRYINLARRNYAKMSACLDVNITGQSAFGTSAQPGYAIPGATIPGSLPNTIANNFNEPGASSTASNNFVTIPGVELYSYSYAKPFLRAQFEGYDSIIYVSDISVSWGGYMPTLNWCPWPNLQAYARVTNLGVASYPSLWSQKGYGENGQVYLFPVPTNISPGTMEWQCVCTPKSLFTNDDYEALPQIVHSAIPYYAARMAYLGQQRTGMAQIMSGLFKQELEDNGVAIDWGHAEGYYNQGWP